MLTVWLNCVWRSLCRFSYCYLAVFQREEKKIAKKNYINVYLYCLFVYICFIKQRKNEHNTFNRN